LTSNGGQDVFVLKLSPCKPESAVDTINACDYYTWIDSISYVANNDTATFTLENYRGCDSVVTLDLTISTPNTGVDVITTCDSLTWIDSITYRANNNSAKYTLINATGCDSVVTLDLTINSNTGVDLITACKSYTWIDGNTYTATNNAATFVLTNANGCDSLVTLNLTIKTIDVRVTSVAPWITAKIVGASFQWLDCDNNFAKIVGATSRTYTATKNGSYAVEITKNGCTDTSECITISGVGIAKNNVLNDVSIFPNPTSGKLSVDFGKVYPNVAFDLTNIQGQLIQSWSFENISEVELDIQEPKGVYLLHIKAGEEQSVFRIVKE